MAKLVSIVFLVLVFSSALAFPERKKRSLGFNGLGVSGAKTGAAASAGAIGASSSSSSSSESGGCDNCSDSDDGLTKGQSFARASAAASVYSYK